MKSMHFSRLANNVMMVSLSRLKAMPYASQPSSDHRFCAAPMMDWSDRHCRYFWRLMSQKTLVYTEMVTTGALLHGDQERHLAFHPAEHPIALQLGGSDPRELAQCAHLAQDWGYDEVNLNCGCPSDRVQNNRIGACLMQEPERVAECLATMKAATDLPVTVKHRIGVDDMDTDADLTHFVGKLYESGCRTFIVHARKAWLQGLSPKENRTVPPLDYHRVKQLKRDYPDCEIVINGGVTGLDQAESLLQDLDGVMLGREVYTNPYLLAQVDQRLFGSERPAPSRDQVLEAFMEYIGTQLAQGLSLKYMTRHILGLYQGQPGSRQFRRIISERAHRPGAGLEVLEAAHEAMQASAVAVAQRREIRDQEEHSKVAEPL